MCGSSDSRSTGATLFFEQQHLATVTMKMAMTAIVMKKNPSTLMLWEVRKEVSEAGNCSGNAQTEAEKRRHDDEEEGEGVGEEVEGI